MNDEYNSIYYTVGSLSPEIALMIATKGIVTGAKKGVKITFKVTKTVSKPPGKLNGGKIIEGFDDKILKGVGGQSSNTNGPGTWKQTNESMSANARAYQKFVTGAKEGMVYEVNGVKFDGYNNGILVEAKGDYSNFVNKNTGEFYDWFTGKDSLIRQAKRQLLVAKGSNVQWYFNDLTSMNAVKTLFNGKINGIDFKLKARN